MNAPKLEKQLAKLTGPNSLFESIHKQQLKTGFSFTPSHKLKSKKPKP